MSAGTYQFLDLAPWGGTRGAIANASTAEAMRTWYVSLCARRAVRRNGEPACHLVIAGGCSRHRVVLFVTGSAADGTLPQIRRS
jgi:hypothetical protein